MRRFGSGIHRLPEQHEVQTSFDHANCANTWWSFHFKNALSVPTSVISMRGHSNIHRLVAHMASARSQNTTFTPIHTDKCFERCANSTEGGRADNKRLVMDVRLSHKL